MHFRLLTRRSTNGVFIQPELSILTWMLKQHQICLAVSWNCQNYLEGLMGSIEDQQRIFVNTTIQHCRKFVNKIVKKLKIKQAGSKQARCEPVTCL